MKNCPYCSEEIQEDAIKCKHCSEWLNNDQRQPGSFTGGSMDARAIAKGIKQKEQDDFGKGCLGFVALVVAIGAGLLNPILGIIVFIILIGLVAKWYYRE